MLYAHAARVLPPEEQTAVFALSPLPRNAAQIIFPLFAALIAGLAPGAALALGAISYGATAPGRPPPGGRDPSDAPAEPNATRS